MNRNIIIQNIKYLCASKGIPISQLEKEISVSPGFLTRMSTSYPSIEKIVAVAKYFKISIDTLLGLNNNISFPIANSFIEKLIEDTAKRKIRWDSFEFKDIRLKSDKIPRSLLDFNPVEYLITGKEVENEILFAYFRGGYLQLAHLEYLNDKQINKLYIKADEMSELVQIDNISDDDVSRLYYDAVVSYEVDKSYVKARDFMDNYVNEIDPTSCTGCIIFETNTNNIISKIEFTQQDAIDNRISLCGDFFYDYKDDLGLVSKAKMSEGHVLKLYSDDKTMILTELYCTYNESINIIRCILDSSGFEINQSLLEKINLGSDFELNK